MERLEEGTVRWSREVLGTYSCLRDCPGGLPPIAGSLGAKTEGLSQQPCSCETVLGTFQMEEREGTGP